jgi:PHD/YefM family antitoxin component YafN of YafNO toxin-antitoxin module
MGLPISGLISRPFLDAASGGQPLLVHHRGHVAAVLLDPDTYAELESLATEALAIDHAARPRS